MQVIVIFLSHMRDAYNRLFVTRWYWVTTSERRMLLFAPSGSSGTSHFVL